MQSRTGLAEKAAAMIPTMVSGARDGAEVQALLVFVLFGSLCRRRQHERRTSRCSSCGLDAGSRKKKGSVTF
jgi:ligand-binding sensor protein